MADSSTYSGSSKEERDSSHQNEQRSPSPLSSPASAAPVDPTSEDAGKQQPPKKKRKRTRVTPEQLAELESLFAAERSPTASRRKQISEKLGMQERQTQVWFQNRRAKAKQVEGQKASNKAKTDNGKDAPLKDVVLPTLTAGPNGELEDVIHEPTRVTIIPCKEVRVGGWTRLSSDASKNDLIAYICDAERRVTWFIHSSGSSVKMDIPFDIISDMKIVPTTANSVQASIFLSEPPSFFVEERHTWRDGKTTGRWVRCADWTEGCQASSVLRHDVLGATNPLTYLWQHIVAYRRGSKSQPNGDTFGPPSAQAPFPSPLPPSQQDYGGYLDGPQRRPHHSSYSPVPAHGLRPNTTSPSGYSNAMLPPGPRSPMHSATVPSERPEASRSVAEVPRFQISSDGAPQDILPPVTSSHHIPQLNRYDEIGQLTRPRNFHNGSSVPFAGIPHEPASNAAYWSNRR